MLGPSAPSAHAMRVAQGRAALGLLASVEFDIVDLVMAHLRAAPVPLAALRRHRPAEPAGARGGHPARRAQGRAWPSEMCNICAETTRSGTHGGITTNCNSGVCE